MVQGLGHGHSHCDGICMLHNLNIVHQIRVMLQCWPQDGSGLVGWTGWSILGADLCGPQVHFWGQGKQDPINSLDHSRPCARVHNPLHSGAS